LKDAFFANLSTPQAVVPVKCDVQAVELPTTSKVKPKLKLRKKVDDNPFESDNEESETLPAKKSIANKAKRTETDNKKPEEPPLSPEPKKGGVKVKAKRASSSGDEDNGEERPKKKRAAAKR
jgi:Mg-chelatase subunit ChlI